ncbi:MAG: tetratricopeptide repeat protein [Verrucomicrobiales bacterium]
MRIVIRVLLVILVVELGLMAWLWRGREAATAPVTDAAPTPRVSWSALEPETAETIRAMEAKTDVKNADHWLALAAVYRAFALLPAAESSYRRADEIRRLTPNEQLAWGVTLSRMGRTAEARRILEEVRMRDPSLKLACTSFLAKDRLREKEAAGAERYLSELTGDLPSGIALCRLWIREGKPQKALEHLEPWLREVRDELRLHQMASWALRDLGDEAQAEVARQLAAYCRDGTPRSDFSQTEDLGVRGRFGSEAKRAKAQEWLAKGETEKGVGALLEVFRATGDHAAAMQAAQMAFSANRFDEAGAILAEADRLVGPSAESQHLLGQMALARGEAASAVEAWKRGLELRANRNRMTNVALLRSLVEKGDPGEAARFRGLISFEMAKLSLEQGDWQNAYEQFAAASRQLPDHGPSWYYLGELFRRNGNVEQAMEAYRTCLQANPNHGRAWHALRLMERER